MKKFYAFALILGLMTTPAMAKTQDMIVNGYSISVETHLQNGTTLIPLRQIGDLLNLTTDYSASTNSINVSTLIYKKPRGIYMKLGNRTAIVTGDISGMEVQVETKMAVAPTMINGTTYVPLRFIAEIFGCDVNLSNGVIHIIKNPGILDINKTQNDINMGIDGVSQAELNYLNDSETINKYYKDIYYNYYSDFLRAAQREFSMFKDPYCKEYSDSLREVATSLNSEKMYTSEGKEVQKAMLIELNTIATEFSNIYNGKILNRESVSDAMTERGKAISQFAIAARSFKIDLIGTEFKQVSNNIFQWG